MDEKERLKLKLELKEEIRTELLAEIQKEQIISPAKPWATLSHYLDQNLSSLFSKSFNRYRAKNGIMAIVRETIGVRNVLQLTEDEALLAKEIIDCILAKIQAVKGK